MRLSGEELSWPRAGVHRPGRQKTVPTPQNSTLRLGSIWGVRTASPKAEKGRFHPCTPPPPAMSVPTQPSIHLSSKFFFSSTYGVQGSVLRHGGKVVTRTHQVPTPQQLLNC